MDDTTPPPMQPSQLFHWAIETKCSERHEISVGKLDELREKMDQKIEYIRRDMKAASDDYVEHGKKLAVLLGANGHGGKVDEFIKGMEDHEHRVRVVEAAVQKGWVIAGMIAALAAAVMSLFINKIAS